MKQTLLYCFLLFTLPAAFCQTSDDFSDGNFLEAPQWSGNTESFIINDQQQLQLSAADAGSATLYLPVNFTPAFEWFFYLKTDFAPSGSNRLQVYLQNSSEQFASGNGYFLEFGESGNEDALRFFRQHSDGTSELLAEGTPGAFGDAPAYFVKIIRNDTGEWEVLISENGIIFQTEMTFLDNTFLNEESGWFGLTCEYTASRKDLFFFDDFYWGPIRIDTFPPALITLEVFDEQTIHLVFNEPLEIASAQNPQNFQITPTIGMPESVEIAAPNELFLNLAPPLTSLQEYQLSIKNIADQNGNVLAGFDTTFIFTKIETPVADDIFINEILFNPPTGGSDFVEIYNASAKVFDLQSLRIANVRDTNAITAERLFYPGEYLVLTEDADFIQSQYTVANPDWLLVQNLPSFPNEAGSVAIIAQEVIDAFDYSEDFHNALLNDEDGVSLERLSLNQPTQNAGNWQSAASSAGYATPTATNSQVIGTGNNPVTSGIFTLPSSRISPDGDGFEDVLQINYETDQPGYTGSLYVYNAAGQLVYRILSNELLSTSGTLRWDGNTTDGQKIPIGIYVLWMEVVHPDGSVAQQKEPIIVAGNLR